jgi:hypothetical protein
LNGRSHRTKCQRKTVVAGWTITRLSRQPGHHRASKAKTADRENGNAIIEPNASVIDPWVCGQSLWPTGDERSRDYR